MEKLYFNALVMDVIHQNNFVFLDCLTDIYGRKYIKLSDDACTMENQLNIATPLSFISLYALAQTNHMELDSVEKLDDFKDIGNREVVQTCVQTMRLILQKDYNQLYLAFLTHTLYLLRKNIADEKTILIKYLYHLLKPINLIKCSKCTYPVHPDKVFYINPIDCKIECDNCRKGESFELKPKTIKEMQNIYKCEFDNMHTIHISSSFYILYVLTECIAHRYESSKYLEIYLKHIKNS